MIVSSLAKSTPTEAEIALWQAIRLYEVEAFDRVTLDENTGEEKQYVRITFKEEYIEFDGLTSALNKARWFIAYLEKGAKISVMVRHMDAYRGVTFRGNTPL